jgi:hypothetical protein
VKRFAVTALLILALSLSLACGLISNLVGGGSNYTATNQLWSDVPAMPGFTASQVSDIPLPIKLLLRTIIGNMGRLNPQGQDQSTGNIDWIAFNSSGTPTDVQNFYTPDRMTAAGWDPSDSSTCLSGSAQGTSTSQVGDMCVFSKTQSSSQTYLAIIATQDQSTNQTTVFFLRLEQVVTPTP